MQAAGFPKGTAAGTSGLELAFDEVLAGTPGGKLFASGDDGRTLIARRAPIAGEPVRTTIDADLQDATAAALGSTFGGAAVLDAENGNVLALAGQAFSAPQPPGSTFKVITATAALETGKTKLERGVPGRDRRPSSTDGGLQRLRRVLRRHPARELRPLLQQRLRPARRPESAATRWSRRPSCSASTRRRPSTTPRHWP